jgi:hypothetical protein
MHTQKQMSRLLDVGQKKRFVGHVNAEDVAELGEITGGYVSQFSSAV